VATSWRSDNPPINYVCEASAERTVTPVGTFCLLHCVMTLS